MRLRDLAVQGLKRLLGLIHPRRWIGLFSPANIRQHGMAVALIALLTYLIGNFPANPPDPPRDQHDLCRIFHQQPQWYDDAAQSFRHWGTPIAIQMAFVQTESGFGSYVQPPRRWLLGFIPWKRPSSAYGYAQAQDPVWREYITDTNNFLARRSSMRDALDFIGWYNHQTHKRLGISLKNADHLYLAYHEGRTGYLRQSYRHKPGIRALAQRVARQATRYDRQLQRCEKRLRCRHFYQIWPFCS